jgi:KDO2-lipid IV(A) lauroyltransferase
MYMRALEAQVSLAPEQYLWVHRRFKTRPPGEAPVYA